MRSRDEVEALEKLIGQLEGLHSEISQLAKKSPNDGLNKFKLKLVNKVISDGNAILQGGYRPFDDFEQFEEDDLPTNSDVTMIISQYIEQTERFRSDNVASDRSRYFYLVNEALSDIPAKMPTRVGAEKK